MNDSELPPRLVESASTSGHVRSLLKAASAERPDDHVLGGALAGFLQGGATGGAVTGTADAQLPHAHLTSAAAPKASLLGAVAAAKAPLALGTLVLLGAAAFVGSRWTAATSSSTPRAAAPVMTASPVAPTPAPIAPPETTMNVHDLPSAATPTAPRLPDLRSAAPSTPVEAEPAHVVADSSFEAEVKKLRGARARLGGGDAAGALAELDDYDRSFSGGALVPESRAMRIDALLALGRGAEARSLAETFLREHPRSPQANRIRRIAEGSTR